MTLVVATPTKIYVDTRITLKETLTDGMGEEHIVQAGYNGICKLMPNGAEGITSGVIHHTVGFGDFNVVKALNEVLSKTGLDVFIEMIPGLAKLMAPSRSVSGLVWVNENNDICSLISSSRELAYNVYDTSVEAFGHSSDIFEYLHAFYRMDIEDAFLLTTSQCEYSCSGDYYVYDVEQKTQSRIVMTDEELEKRLNEIKLNMALEMTDHTLLRLRLNKPKDDYVPATA